MAIAPTKLAKGTSEIAKKKQAQNEKRPNNKRNCLLLSTAPELFRVDKQTDAANLCISHGAREQDSRQFSCLRVRRPDWTDCTAVHTRNKMHPAPFNFATPQHRWRCLFRLKLSTHVATLSVFFKGIGRRILILSRGRTTHRWLDLPPRPPRGAAA